MNSFPTLAPRNVGVAVDVGIDASFIALTYDGNDTFTFSNASEREIHT